MKFEINPAPLPSPKHTHTHTKLSDVYGYQNIQQQNDLDKFESKWQELMVAVEKGFKCNEEQGAMTLPKNYKERRK